MDDNSRMRDSRQDASGRVRGMPRRAEADSHVVDQGPVVAVRGAATILRELVVPAFVHPALIVGSIAMLSVLSSPLHAGTFVTWDASTDPKGIAASADGVNVSVTYNPATFNEKDPSQSSGNMSGSNYNPPGSGSQSYIDVQQDIGMTWTFDQPVEDLMLYLYFWRGIGLGGPPDGNYTFDQTPTIQSGLAGGTINGNSFVVTSNESFYSGILSFPGQLTSLSLLTPATGNSGGNGYTMSFTAVPEPATTAILLSAGGVLALWRCRRRR